MHAPNAKSISTKTETVEDQLQRQVRLQEYWADNAVSATIGFNKNKPEELVAGLQKYSHRLKSSSFLTREHGYAQAPYESISKGDFEQMSMGINFQHPLVHGADMEIDACENGVCPVR
jgi:hypothetical protein